MKILLLQGPLGPFFQSLSQALSDAGHEVYKIHFNGGDECWRCVGHNERFTASRRPGTPSFAALSSAMASTASSVTVIAVITTSRPSVFAS